MPWPRCARNTYSLVANVRRVSTTSANRFQNYYLTRTSDGQLVRLKLSNAKQLLGIVSARGTRNYNEDRCRAVTLEIPNGTLSKAMHRESNRLYAGVFDGHGGPLVSEWLAENLHSRLETVSLDDLSGILTTLRGFGGYFRRFKIPTIFDGFVDRNGHLLDNVSNTDLTIDQRIMLAFMSADVQCLDLLRDDGPDGYHEGSTGSIAVIEPHDEKPFWDSTTYEIVVGHVGDTRILLCDATTGVAQSLTTGDHHPGNPLEQERLRKYAGFVMTDSWGDERIMGMLATSRAFGDAKLKRFGVSAEPDIVRYSINRDNPAAFMVLITDGISSVMSDQEVVDIAKQAPDPTTSAKKIIDIADQYGTEDNCTAMVIRLRGWGTQMHDLTKDLREYRLSNATMSNRQSW